MTKKVSKSQQRKRGRRVFVAHGRNLRARDAMSQFLRAIDLQPIEWTQALAALGPTPRVEDIVRKGISGANAIVVLFTGDDEVRLRRPFQSLNDGDDEKQLRPQARPNVIFEAGMALASAPSQTVLVQLGPTKFFSNILGRYVLVMDDTPEKRNELAQRLIKAGCAVNLSGDAWMSEGNFSEAIVFARTEESVLQMYREYLDLWEVIPLIPPSVGTRGLAKAKVREYMRGPEECIVKLPDHDAKDLVAQIEERMLPRMDLKKRWLPIAILVSSFMTYKLTGIITPSDLWAKFELYQAEGVVKAKDIWTANPFKLHPDQTLEEAVRYMDEKRIKSGLPVVDKSNRFIGFLPHLGGRELVG